MNNVKILLVEDNEDDLDMTMRALRKANLAASVHVARDGVEALDFLFCRGPHATRRIQHQPHVVLLDLKLPKVNGLEVLKQVKSDPRTQMIPIVVLTSSREQRDLVDSYSFGVNSYIVKPVELENFAAAVKDLGVYWLLRNEIPAS